MSNSSRKGETSSLTWHRGVENGGALLQKLKVVIYGGSN